MKSGFYILVGVELRVRLVYIYLSTR